MYVTGVGDHAIQTTWSFVGRSNYVVFLSRHLDRLSIIGIVWRPRDLFPSIFPVVTVCSKLSHATNAYKLCLFCSNFVDDLYDLALIRMIKLFVFHFSPCCSQNSSQEPHFSCFYATEILRHKV